MTAALLDHYLASAHAAAHVLDPDRDAITLPEFEPGVRVVTITGDHMVVTRVDEVFGIHSPAARP